MPKKITEEEKQRIKEEKQHIKEEAKNKKIHEQLEAKLKKQKEREEKIKAKEDHQKQKENEMTNFINTKKEIPKNNYKPIFKIIQDSGSVINKIIHIADIHIKLNEQHEKYNIVFDRFYVELADIKKQNPNTIVCLCGDLFQTKDMFKTKTFYYTLSFLRNVANIFPLIIITGNHDTIEDNKDDIDPIGTILKETHIDNTYYLKSSGVYVYNNIIFGVSSIFDKYILTSQETTEIYEQHITNNKYQSEYIKKIGLYHGQVGCVQFNNLWYHSETCKSIDVFGKYDYMLLGDIHRFQYINESKTAAYCSSMISQTTSETDDYHGYLEWNIMNGESNYHILKNEYGHHEIDIEKIIEQNSLEEFNKCKSITKPNLIVSEELIKSELDKYKSGHLMITYNEKLNGYLCVQNIMEKIKSIYPNFSFTWKVLFDKNNMNKKRIDIKEVSKIGEIIDNNQIDNLMKNYMENKYANLSEESRNKVLDYFKKITEESNSNEDINYINSDWKILWLEFDYMYGYGPNNVIDFTKYPPNDVIGIFGDNATGKSSIIDIITFMLYSRSARDESSSNPKDIININSNKSQGKIIIESNGIKYLIKKVCYRKNKNIRTKMELFELTKEQNASKIYKLFDEIYYMKCLTDENRNKTTKILTPIIGTYENFITTSILLQGNQKTFKSKTNAQKKDFLCQILKIDHFNKSKEHIDTHFTALKQQLTASKKIYDSINIGSQSVENLQKELDDIDSNILLELGNELHNLEENINTNNIEIEKSQKELIPINVVNSIQNEEDLESNMFEIKTLKNKIEIKYKNINNFKQLIENINKQIENMLLIRKCSEIETNYDKHLSNIKLDQKMVLDKIDELNKLKQNFPIIKIDPKITKFNQNQLLKTKEAELNKLSTNILTDQLFIIQKQLNDLNLLSKSDIIIKSNYQNKDLIKQKLNKICTSIDDLNTQKQNKHLINISPDLTLINQTEKLDDLNNNLFELDNYFESNNVKQMLRTKLKLITDYNNLMSSNTDIIYESLNKLKTIEYNREEYLEIIDSIIDTLNIVLKKETTNKHIIIKRYDILMKQQSEYDNKINEKNKFLAEIESVNNILKNLELNKAVKNCIEEIDIQINNLKIEQKNLNDQNHDSKEYMELQEQLKQEILLNREINNIKNKIIEIEKNKQLVVDQIKQIKLNIDNLENNDKSFKNIVEIDNKILDLRKNLDKIDDKNSEIYVMYNKLQTEKNLKTKYENQIMEHNKSILTEVLEIKKFEINQNRIETDIELYNKIKESIFTNKITENKIADNRRKNKEISDRIKDINMKIIEQNSIKIKNQKIINDIQIATTEINKIKTEYDIYSILSTIASRDGIQLYLLEQYLYLITNRINMILSGLIDKKIELILDGETIDLNITSKNKQIYTISGMENLMFDVVFKIIFGQISVIPKCNILFIDESISVLDKNRMETIEDLFAFLRQYYNSVFLITHIKEVKVHITNYLDIQRINDYSLLFNVDNFIILREPFDNKIDEDGIDEKDSEQNINDEININEITKTSKVKRTKKT